MNEELMISGARKQGQNQLIKDTGALDQNIPFIEKHFSLTNFEKYILNSKENFYDVKQYVLQGKGDQLHIRFNLWRMFLKVFDVNDSIEEKLQALQRHRETYLKHSDKLLKKENIKKDPLSRDQSDDIWNNYFANNELKNEIKKDVDRTYSDKEFFSNLKIKSLLSNVLFIWSKINHSISYRQGMNEIAASVIYVYFQEFTGEKQTQECQAADFYCQFNNIKYAEADIYTVFEKIMNEGGHMEMFRPPSTNKSDKKSTTPILSKCAEIQNNFLKIVDFELFKHLRFLGVEFQIFLLRWIRCLFTREFHFEDSLRLWDAIFMDFLEVSEGSIFPLVDSFALAMISYVRDYVLEKEDAALCLQRFLKYPPMEDLQRLIDTTFKYKQLLKNPPQEQENSQLNENQETPVFHQTSNE